MAAHKHHPSHAHQVTECKHPLLWHRPKEAYSSVLWAWLTHGDPTLIGRDCHVILSKQRTLHVYNLPGLLFKTSLTCSVYNMYCNNCVSLICGIAAWSKYTWSRQESSRHDDKLKLLVIRGVWQGGLSTSLEDAASSLGDKCCVTLLLNARCSWSKYTWSR